MTTWLPQESIRRKRDGGRLSEEELRAIARGLADGELDDAQAAAFAMAVYFRGMQAGECATFTWAMRDTGEVFDWRREGLRGPVLDKHSTGGVGDAVSLLLGPMLAACGAFVPMISGRGLGHTGGTLDKLESIPGYEVRPERARMIRTLREAGVVIVGAGERLAPADRRLYAIRDVTATVDCVPLVTASILSQ
jgi:thymidine phosphorylase